MKGKRSRRRRKQHSPLAKEILLAGKHASALATNASLLAASSGVTEDRRETERDDECLDQALLAELQEETTPGVYRSYLPCRLLDTLPANCVDVHPTELRYCRVSVERFMHQVEKKRKTNPSNRRLGVDGTTYVTWQFMPQRMVREKRRLGDAFFHEAGFYDDDDDDTDDGGQ